MSVPDLLTLAGLSGAVSLLFEVLKRAVQPTDAMLDRFGALAAVGLGVVVGGAAALIGGADVAQAVINGFYAGLGAIGIYEVVS